jgi:uncharacterized protein YjbJ (UPF0337 family)
MFPSFFSHKKRELMGFLHILRGKLTGDEHERIKGANEALNALEEEREIYLREKRAAEIKLEPELGGYKPFVPQDKVQREVSNRDISAC